MLSSRPLGVDLGDKRTGLAVGDRETGIVSPVGLIEKPMQGSDGGAALRTEILSAAQAYDADALVLGLPLNMDDTEGPRAKLVRAFGDALAKETELAIEYFDERLTSIDADWAMAGSGMTHKQKKQRRDALAAAAMLRGYMGL